MPLWYKQVFEMGEKEPMASHVAIRAVNEQKKTGHQLVLVPGKILYPLFADAQSFDDGSITLFILFSGVVEQSTSPADQLEQTTPRVVILFMDLEMLGEMLDALGEKCDLDFR
jgi:hypothetical protein